MNDGMETLYRVSRLLANLGWVAFDFGCSTLWTLCLGQWEFGRSGWPARQDGGTSKSKSTQPSVHAQVYEQMGHPVECRSMYNVQGGQRGFNTGNLIILYTG